MRKISGYENIQESGSFKRLAPGGYIVKILDVSDNLEKEYLKVSFDVAEGKEKNFFSTEYKNDTRADKKWPNAGTFIRSYKEKALPMLKGFTTAIEKSNKDYVWDFDEKKLKGKLVGLVLGEEEFLNSSGKVRVRTYVNAVRSVDVIRDGKFEIPELRKLDPTKVQATTATKSAPPVSDPFSDNEPTQPSSADFDNPWGGDDSDENPFA